MGVALPGDGSSMVAEAVGLRAAISLLLRDGLPPGEVAAVGDNVAVSRHAAAHGRLHRGRLHALLEAPLWRRWRHAAGGRGV